MLVLTNGKIWTGDSFVRSVTLRGDRIVTLDGESPAGARVVDLRGRLVVPGFIDNHLHFVMGSLQLEQVQLRDASSPAEFASRIAAHARKIGPDRWVTGGEWDEQRWSPPRLPSRETIDAVTGRNPVFVTRLDLHMGLANSVALRLSGITRETPDPPGGTIGRDAEGEPTGVLRDAAMSLLTRVIPSPSVTERASAMRSGLREAARLGITSFCDMGIHAGSFEDLRAFRLLEDQGSLTARVWMYPPIADWEAAVRARTPASSQVRIAGVKGFADGSLGSSTAAFRKPYEGEPENRGLLMEAMGNGSMRAWIADAGASGLQLAIHAIGDRANDEVLAMLESLPAHRERRFRIEHAQHLDAPLVRRFADAAVIAAAQPYHAVDDGRWAEAKIGTARARWSFPFRSLLDAGAHLTFGSDWPVAPLDPIQGIHAAVTRRTLDGRRPEGWIPEQKITVAEALRCYTTDGAWALFAEGEIGRIAPGYRADLAVLSGDLFSIAPEEIGRVRVELTIFDGRVIYEA